jgi:hypothetical protein
MIKRRLKQRSKLRIESRFQRECFNKKKENVSIMYDLLSQIVEFTLKIKLICLLNDSIHR